MTLQNEDKALAAFAGIGTLLLTQPDPQSAHAGAILIGIGTVLKGIWGFGTSPAPKTEPISPDK